MLSLIVALAVAPTSGAEPPVQEIVVTAKRDKCSVQYGQHPVSDAQLQSLSQSWALGTPVRVIEPRGANLKCEFEIMKTLDRHGQHLAQFVARSEDLSPEEERADAAEDAAAERKSTTPPPAQPPFVSATPFSATSPMPTALPALPVSRSSRRGTSPSYSSIPAPAGIITLSCTMADRAAPYRLDVVINEGKGTVTPSRPDTGAGSEMKAVFMPAAVRFGPFTIDRTSLRIRRESGVPNNPGAAPTIVDGQCAPADLHRMF